MSVWVKVNSFYKQRGVIKFDSFVLFTEHMALKLPVANKPWIVVEGIYNELDEIQSVQKEINKTVLYTGTIAKRYGILNLIEAFSNMESPEYRLWICGEGDCRTIIETYSKTDKRVTYFGIIPRNEILIMQRRATVLVNPRTSEGEFTKYSFPSKVMEYLASGTPCIMHRLKGIPDEYYNYCFVPENEGVESLKKAIQDVCEKNQTELVEFGNTASSFIKNCKNSEIQASKIFTLLKIN